MSGLNAVITNNNQQTDIIVNDGGEKKAQRFEIAPMEIIKTRLNLLEKICNNVRSAKQQLPVIVSMNEMTRYALNASASSMYLIDADNSELDKFTDGPLGKEFIEYKVSEQIGITRWIIQNAQPLLINDVNQNEHFAKFKNEVTGLVTRSVVCAPLIIGNKVAGVLKSLNKLDASDFTERDLQTLTGLAANAAQTMENIKLSESLLYSYKDTVKKLVSSLDARETATSRHSRRVSEYALIGAAGLSLSENEKQTIGCGAILHDIGLLSIPASLLNKREALTNDELNTIKKHPVIGYNILRGIPSLNEVSKLILYHHERYDGKGYPCGLKGDTIPIGARLIAVADAFTSMTEKHSYRAAVLAKDALVELSKYAGSQFCPVATKAFVIGYIKSRSKAKVTIKKQ